MVPSARPRLSGGERRAEEGDRARQHQRPAGSLSHPREEKERKARRQAPDGRRSGEHRQPEQEDPATAEEVGEAAAEHEQPRERQQAAVQDSLHRLGLDAEVLHDRGERERNRRLVDQDHAVGRVIATSTRRAVAVPFAGTMG
jgi:hypothetical protein